MKFLLDADLPRSAATVIVAAGHEAVDWRDVGDGSAPDEKVAQHAKDFDGGCRDETRGPQAGRLNEFDYGMAL